MKRPVRYPKLLGAGLLVGAGIGLLLLAALGAGSGLFSRLENAPLASAAQPVVPEVNLPAPDFELTTLSSEPLRLSDLRGKVVVLNFWATWCGPCRQEMPLLQRYYQKLSPEVVILAVNDGEPQASVRSYVDELGLTFTILLDPRLEAENLYRVRAFPTTFFIDRKGVIRYQHVGLLQEDQLIGYLQQVGILQ